MKLKKCFIFLAVINFSVIFFSCKEPVRGYFEYWSSTCQVAGVEYISPCTVINGKPNVSAQGDSNNEVVIYLNLINPEQHDTLAKNSVEFFTLSCGTIISQEQINPDTIKIKAKLDDAYEGETITLSGCLWPDNRTGYDDVAALKKSNPELFYSTSFIQNTPPENIKNLSNQESSHKYYQNTQKHHVSFDIPDRSKNKNKDAQFEICCYSKEDGSFLGKQIVPMPQSGNSISYCFESIQAENLYYDFTVQVIGKHGLKSEIVSTNGALGVQILNEPGITFSLDYNGKKDSENYEYIEVDSANDKVTCTISSENGSTIEGDINGTTIASSTNKYEQQLGTGKYTINATIRRDGSRPVSVTKRVAVITALKDASVTFGSNGTQNGKTLSKGGYTYDAIEYTGTSLSMSVSNLNSDSQMQIKINNVNQNISNSYTLADGFNIISVKLTKDGCNDKTDTKYVYVVKTPSAPRITFNNGSVTGTTTVGNEQADIVKYSLLSNEYLKISVTNTESENATMIVEIDNTSAEGNISNLALVDGAHTITTTVKRQYCNDVVTRKTIWIQFKTIVVTVGTCELWSDTDDAGGNSELCGELSLKINDNPWNELVTFYKDEFEEKKWQAFTHNTVWFASANRSDYIYYRSNGMYEHDSDTIESSNDSIPDVFTYLSIDSIVAHVRNGLGNPYFNIVNSGTSGTNKLEHWIELVVTEQN
ncbi:MAG: hypothetical protein K6E69_08030 [Treponema sp.]|uniref:hypothetical protein n=1 Tax=Treponema sp. TaxID=166 RepID=UPI00298D846E|nr:hypothetical protein [Treponema sp.]MCR5387054.1 hypothetical protein [Treponema sp.]